MSSRENSLGHLASSPGRLHYHPCIVLLESQDTVKSYGNAHAYCPTGWQGTSRPVGEILVHTSADFDPCAAGVDCFHDTIQVNPQTSDWHTMSIAEEMIGTVVVGG